MCNQCDMCSWRAFTNLFSSRRFTLEFRDVASGRAIKQKLSLGNISVHRRNRGGGGGGMKLGDDDLGRAGRDPFSCEFRELRSGVMLMIIIL